MTVDVAIVGGGLSGLSAAMELVLQGVHVALFEQSPRLGGRCYSYPDKKTGDIVDNGQHVLLGAYKHTLRYLEIVGTRDSLKKQPTLLLPLHHPVKGFTELKLPSLPRPLHLTAGMLKFKLLSLKERRQLLNVGVALRRWNARLEEELSSLTVSEWLIQLKQSRVAQECLWYPLAVSIMNEVPQHASALLFGRSLKAAFFGSTSDASILLPTIGQSELYVDGAERILRHKKAKIFMNAEVSTLEVLHSNVKGVRLKNGTCCFAGAVISAVPYFGVKKIIPPNFHHTVPFSNVELFQSSPIVSLHLWFDAEFMEADFTGLIGKRLQWVFNRRRIMGSRGRGSSYLSAVVSGAHDIVDLSKTRLVQIACEDLKDVFPAYARAKLLHSVVIKEKRATFSPTNETEPFRPAAETPIRNFFLAGDWTDTGLPATIEGAILSGVNAAKIISG